MNLCRSSQFNFYIRSRIFRVDFHCKSLFINNLCSWLVFLGDVSLHITRFGRAVNAVRTRERFIIEMHSSVNAHIVQFERVIVTQETCEVVAVISVAHRFEGARLGVLEKVISRLVHRAGTILTQDEVWKVIIICKLTQEFCFTPQPRGLRLQLSV